ncbi:MAG TPA: GNAT family N-acetyltransferase [Planctomycetota bacterium]|nr:GNAT family N-acetyltransferase [Planctomycetota bacterium]
MTPVLQLRPFELEEAGVVAPWFVAPGLAVPPGAAGRTWAARMLADPRIVARTARADEQRVGFVRLDIGPDRIAELTLVVAPELRRQGLGRSILAAITLEARSRSVRRLRAAVDPANRGALGFFLANGFRRRGQSGGTLHLERSLRLAGSQEPLEIEV